MQNHRHKILIIGGGLGGLVLAIRLLRNGVPCALIEKRSYPFHRVCGEYISNEIRPFLERESLFPHEIKATEINEFQLSAVSGNQTILPLDLGGFGLSRYYFDKYLFDIALNEGLTFFQEEAQQISFDGKIFTVNGSKHEHTAEILVCAYGKRSRLDKQLNRSFIQKRSPYVGVKYHARLEYPANRVALHNFEKGYCGINRIENGIINICYLSHRDNLKAYKDIKEMEENVLFKNPHLKSIFKNADFIFEKPEVINEISFETKGPVEQNCLMIGDAAGMITPLNGNGMAMAIQSAYILSELLIDTCKSDALQRELLNNAYSAAWHKLFYARLQRGRIVQKLFGNTTLSDLAVKLVTHVKPMARYLIKHSHGDVF
ncbi:MAG TPA: FAD-dependent monooxygenase [Cyclobacteriaceae bacterium]|nr:FAD-dependent monooxygenase [Cyclobacteriaceae bacterium]